MKGRRVTIFNPKSKHNNKDGIVTAVYKDRNKARIKLNDGTFCVLSLDGLSVH